MGGSPLATNGPPKPVPPPAAPEDSNPRIFTDGANQAGTKYPTTEITPSGQFAGPDGKPKTAAQTLQQEVDANTPDNANPAGRRGLGEASTIATSPFGLLDDAPVDKKRLFGL